MDGDHNPGGLEELSGSELLTAQARGHIEHLHADWMTARQKWAGFYSQVELIDKSSPEFQSAYVDQQLAEVRLGAVVVAFEALEELVKPVGINSWAELASSLTAQHFEAQHATVSS